MSESSKAKKKWNMECVDIQNMKVKCIHLTIDLEESYDKEEEDNEDIVVLEKTEEKRNSS